MQYAEDKKRFAELLSKFTGINVNTISDYLKENTIKSLIENPTTLKATQKQLQKLSELKELRNVTDNLRKHDKQYILHSSSAAQDYFKEYIKDSHDRERFICAFLDNSNRVISTKVMITGTVNESPVFPREIVKEAVLTNARTVLLAHNHPGGTLSPSQADIQVTRKIVEALNAVDVKCVDHIIVADNQSVSLAEKGYIPEPSLNNVMREDSNKYKAVINQKVSIKHRMSIAKEKTSIINELSKNEVSAVKLQQR